MADKNLRLQLILEGLDRITKPLKAITGASSAARRDLGKTREELKQFDALQKQVGTYKAKESRFASDTRAHQDQQQRLAELRTQLEAAEAPTKQLRSELARAEKQAAALGKALDAGEGDANAYLGQQRRLAELRAQLDATEKPTKKLRAEFARVEKQSAALGAKLDASGADLQQLSSKLSAAGIDVADLARHEDRLAERVGHANQALRQQTDQLEKVNKATANSQKLSDISGKATGAGLGMIAAGTATAAPVAMAVKQAMTLETAMANVRKVVDFELPEAFEKMSDDILDISTRIPMAAEGIAEIVAAAGRANVPREELLRFAEDAAKMGVAFDTSAETAGETMAKWRTAFGLPQKGVVQLADQINALTNTYGGNVAGVTEMVTRIGPLGKVGGLAASEIASMAQLLSSVGVESEVGSTGIKNMMLSLTKGEAATKGQAAAFRTLGLDAVDMSKRMQQDAGGAILTVLERLQALPKHAKAGMLTELFGSESVAAIAPMLTSLDQLKKNFTLVGDQSKYAGSMNKEFLAATATTEGATGLAKNALTALNIEMGNALLPTVVEVAKKVTDAAGAVRGWAQENPKLAKGLMIFLSVGAGLLILLGGLALAFGALTFAAAPLGIALGPLLLIVAAVAAVAAAAYLIYDNWGSITAWCAGIWAQIQAATGAAIDWLVDAFLNFTPLGLLMRAFAPALGYLRGLNFSEIGRNLIQGLIGGITSKLGALKSTVIGVASSVSNWFKQKLGIHSPSRVFAGLGGFVMAGLDQGLAANTSGPLARITDLSERMTGAFPVPGGLTGEDGLFSRIADQAGPMTGALPAAGTSEGTSAGADGLLSRIAELSAQMSRAFAVGASGAAMASATPAPAVTRVPAAPPAALSRAGDTFHLHFHGVSGDPADIEEAVRRAMERIERERQAREFDDRDY